MCHVASLSFAAPTGGEVEAAEFHISNSNLHVDVPGKTDPTDEARSVLYVGVPGKADPTN